MTTTHTTPNTKGGAQDAPFEPLSDVGAQLGESPVWSSHDQAIWWVDILGCKLLRTRLSGRTDCWGTPEMPGFVECLGPQIIVGMQTGIFQFDPDTATFDRIVALDTPGQRFNDACQDARGRIWAGTMDIENRRDTGVLYLFDPVRRTLSAKLSGFHTVNGLAWDDTRTRLFVSDSHPSVQMVWTFQVDPDDTLQDKAVFAPFFDLKGRPDGAMLDGEGNYWIAGVSGGTLYRFSPEGDWLTRYPVPVKSPTKPALIGARNPVMVLTSFEDDHNKGRLSIWRAPLPDRHADP
ncbi:SMP-30/gluconolactonase/LRE family protein [Phaeobacter marinintestinus]|uniref:SMP-30/gluconolactonase/LRE family protein n=1 Tax=Falsiphaeobacter marinintestinus TaxID=1492905 RepID=UPI001648F15F|nr:SMP-30/gluconolactonase/LRE family protein [Phaeobacter marinintestinus]